MKKLSLLILCLFAICESYAQDPFYYSIDSNLIKKMPYVNWSADSLQFPADSSPAFDRFFDRLDAVYHGETDHLHIFHIGGSHIQADIYSHKMRQYFQNMAPGLEAQRGFLHPYRLARTNMPKNYLLTYNKDEWSGSRCSIYKDSIPWGLSGVTGIYTGDSTQITLDINGKEHSNYYFDCFRVFFNTWDSTYQVRLSDSSLGYISNYDIEKGYVEFQLYDTAQKISLQIMDQVKDSVVRDSFLMMGMEFMNESPGIQYTSIGANGASYKSYNRASHFEKQLSLYQPNLFIISIGTNDTYTTHFDDSLFYHNYENFMKMVWSINPDCAILLTVPNDSYYKKSYPNKNTQKAADVIKALAKKYQMAVWDMYEIMGGLGSSQKWYLDHLMPKDRIHFRHNGYYIKADLLWWAIIKAWSQRTGTSTDTILKPFLPHPNAQ